MHNRNILLLLATNDSKGVIRLCPENESSSAVQTYGVYFELSGRLPASVEIRNKAAEIIGQTLTKDHIDYIHFIDDGVSVGNGRSCAVYLLRLKDAAFLAPDTWKTMPEILRQLESGKMRNVFNKALQILAGALEGEVAALEVDEEVRRRLELDSKD